MPNLLAFSFEGALAPAFDLRCLQAGGEIPDGWGVGYYPAGEPAATVLKEPSPSRGSIRGTFLRAGEHIASSLFLLHLRRATWGAVSHANTQPFCRAFAGRDWLMAHAGSLRHRLERTPRPPFEPVGSTDTEEIFCDLLSRVAEAGWRTLGEADPEVLHGWFSRLNDHGGLSAVLTDGLDLCVYADRDEGSPVYLCELRPDGALRFGDEDLQVDLEVPGLKRRKGLVVSSAPLRHGGPQTMPWRTLAPGRLLIARHGAIRAEVAPREPVREPARPMPGRPFGRSLPPRPARARVRHLDICHRTVYRYEQPVERSTHLLRLVPVHDPLQHLLAHEIRLSVDGAQRDYEDVFGNRVRRVVIDTPYRELAIEARSRVAVLDVDPLSFRPLHARATIPLVWMPWQGAMLQPYLLPPELPESELHELVDYAMTFVERNDGDILDTLLDLNTTIFGEYAYRQGTTTVQTTPFEVYCERRGVCQDFANLFICLARLLGVPARYVCGYLYTGPKHQNQRQSEASHAWVQVYLPEVGWRGLDPTNGVLTQTDHVRVAVGRNYLDATPTSGTLFGGGGGETLEVDVQVEIAPDPKAAPAAPPRSGPPGSLF